MRRVRPVVGLDVDGVVALERPARVEASEYRVSAWNRWSRSVLVPVVAPSVIGELAREAEIVWASAWGHNAHTALCEALELPQDPWMFLPVQFGKANAVASYAAGRPWALIHDGIDDDPAASSGVLIRVDPQRGLGEVDAGALLQQLTQDSRVPQASTGGRPPAVEGSDHDDRRAEPA